MRLQGEVDLRKNFKNLLCKSDCRLLRKKRLDYKIRAKSSTKTRQCSCKTRSEVLLTLRMRLVVNLPLDNAVTAIFKRPFLFADRDIVLFEVI